MIFYWTAFLICLLITAFFLYGVWICTKDMNAARNERDKEKMIKEAKSFTKMFTYFALCALFTAWLADKIF